MDISLYVLIIILEVAVVVAPNSFHYPVENNFGQNLFQGERPFKDDFDAFHDRHRLSPMPSFPDLMPPPMPSFPDLMPPPMPSFPDLMPPPMPSFPDLMPPPIPSFPGLMPPPIMLPAQPLRDRPYTYTYEDDPYHTDDQHLDQRDRPNSYFDEYGPSAHPYSVGSPHFQPQGGGPNSYSDETASFDHSTHAYSDEYTEQNHPQSGTYEVKIEEISVRPNEPNGNTDSSKPSNTPARTGFDLASLPKKPVSTRAGAVTTSSQSQSTQTVVKKPETVQNSQGAVCNWCLRSNCNPGACKPASNFNAKTDAEKLRDAIARAGTNEEVLFDILMNRSEEQIELIKREYLSFGKNSLEDDVKGDTMLKVKELLLALLKTRAEFFADELKLAFSQRKYGDMILILTPLPPCAISEISSTFLKRHGKTLIKEAKKATSLKFQEFIEELIKAYRYDSVDVDKDVVAINSAGPNALVWTNKRVFIDIFTHRTHSHIKKIQEQYNRKYTRPDFKKVVADSTGGGNLPTGLLAILRNIEDQPDYFTDRIEGALTTQKLIFRGIRDNSAVIRILRGRCGIDLGDIRDAYPKNHDGKLLVEVIKGKTVGDYENALVKLLS